MDTIEVKVGQVWQDKDKRRNTRIEIIAFSAVEGEVIGLVVGTEEERNYNIERLVKRWSLIQDVVVETVNGWDNKVTQTPKVETEETREQWLTRAVKLLTDELFSKLEGVEIPQVRVSVGWPGGKGPKANTIGQCWKKETAGDGIAQIFISPVVGDSAKVLATLAHELIHASDNGASGHRGHFKNTAKALGFEPKWTVVNPGEELTAKLKELAEVMGEYPHSAISEADKPKVQKTYMLKLGPSEACDDCDPDYKLRMTEKWLEEGGAPLCPHGIEMVEVD